MKFRKILALSLTLAFVFSLPISASAASDVPDMSMHMSEFELIQQLSDTPVSELRSEGYSSAEIEEIQNYEETYFKHVESLNELDDATLSKLGYSDVQVYDIRNFTGSENQLARLGATLNLTVSAEDMVFDGDYSRGRLEYEWEWDGVPVMKLQDGVVATWNDWAIEDEAGLVEYYTMNTGEFVDTEWAELSYGDDGYQGQGAGHNFRAGYDGTYAKSGYGFFELRSDVHDEKDLMYHVEYGHAVLKIGFDFSFSILGGGFADSISFGTGVDVADTVTGIYRF